MKRLVPILAAAALLSFCGAPASQPQITDARIRLPAAPGVPGAGYFRLEGFSSMEVLKGASSPAAERIEMHLSSEENGISRMIRLDGVSLPRNGEFEFRPGAHHLMVFGLSPDLRPGDMIPLTLTFEMAQPVTVQASLEAPGGAAHAPH